jgi:hypothetical protein
MELSMLTPSSTPVIARVRVADAEINVLFLITQYLRDLGLSTTVAALLRESGVDPFWLCGPSREIALLREWIFQGEWAHVRAVLGPLRDTLGERGLAAALAHVDKQALLEEFHFVSTPPCRRREIVEYLLKPTTHSAARLNKQEQHRYVRLLNSDASLCGGWSLDEARLRCFESLVPLFRDAIGDDDEESKYLAMPQRQLVALLKDALLLHQERSGVGDHDIVTVVPVSDDAQLIEDESTASSLRLVEPENDISRLPPRDALAQSIDLSQYATRHQATAPGGSKSYRSRNPLVMSMALPRSQRTKDAQLGSGQCGMDAGSLRDDCDDGSSHDERTVEDAETQTDTVSSVDQAVDACEPPASLPINATAEKVAVREEVVNDPERFESSNQTVDTGGDQEPAFARSARSSKTRVVAVDVPLEAWCTSRRSDLPQQPKSPEANKHLDSEEAVIYGQWQEPELDHDGPTIYEDEEQTDPDEEDDNPSSAPLRSYSQLTMDSVVRARVVAEVKEVQAIRAMDFAPDGSEMVIGTNARALRVFDLTEPLASSSSSVTSNAGSLSSSILPLLPVSLERHKHHASSIYTACYNHISPAHAAPLIATGAAESSIKVLSRWTQQETWLRGHSGKSRALCFASPSLLYSASSGDMVIRAWDLDASGTPCVQRLDGHVGEIQAMAIAGSHIGHDRRTLTSSSMDRTVRLWDLRSPHCARVLARTASPASTLAFQPQNSATSVLATGHQDGSISLWDLRISSSKTAKPLATVSHHQDECRAVSWSPDGQWLLSASFDGTLCLLDASSHTSIHAVASFHQHQDKILQAQWHPTQPAIVTTGADKLVKLWAFA